MTNFDLQWCVMVLAKGTNEADLRHICANKLVHAYHIGTLPRWSNQQKEQFEVAVLDRGDIQQIQASFDVLDKRFVKSYGGQLAWEAEAAWGKPK